MKRLRVLKEEKRKQEKFSEVKFIFYCGVLYENGFLQVYGIECLVFS